MTTASIHQPQYLPYLGFFQKLANSDVHVLLDNVQLHRRGLQHRNKIKSSTGWQWLTVPVSSGSREVLSEVRISQTEPWQDKHAKAVSLNYARAPHFAAHGPELVDLLGKPWERLCELNEALIAWVMAKTGIRTELVRASELGVDGSRTDLLVELCRAVGADTYLSGSGGRRYMELERFEEAGIDVAFQEFTHPTYEQIFPAAGFIPDLSVVDPLLCAGAEAVAAWSAEPC
jgi:hypothetical protein